MVGSLVIGPQEDRAGKIGEYLNNKEQRRIRNALFGRVEFLSNTCIWMSQAFQCPASKELKDRCKYILIISLANSRNSEAAITIRE